MTTVPPRDPESNLVPETTFIYVLIDPETNEIRYVGKADDPQNRFYKHMSDKRDTYKRRWINDLQKRGFKPLWQIIEEVPYGQWPERECYWIDHYRSQGCHLTNTATGGSGGGEFPSEVRAKISAAKRGSKLPPFSEETRRKMSLSRKGRKVAPEAVAKTAAGLRGRKVSPETRAKLSEAHKGQPPTMKGRKHTPEARAKMSAAKKGVKRNPHSEEHRRKISEAQIGKTVSAETRAKLSASHKGQIPAMKGRKYTPEARAKMSLNNGKRKRSISPPDTPTL